MNVKFTRPIATHNPNVNAPLTGARRVLLPIVGGMVLAVALAFGAGHASADNAPWGPAGPIVTPQPLPTGTPGAPKQGTAPDEAASGVDESRSRVIQFLNDWQAQLISAATDATLRIGSFVTDFSRARNTMQGIAVTESSEAAPSTEFEQAAPRAFEFPGGWLGMLAAAAVTVLGIGLMASIARSLQALLREQRSANERAGYAALQDFRNQYAARSIEQLMPSISQLVADATGNVTALANQSGIVSMGYEPAPQFTVSGVSGQEFIFTTDPGWITKKLGASRITKVLRLNNVTHSGRVRAQALWERCMADRGPAVAPLSKDWYVVVSTVRGR